MGGTDSPENLIELSVEEHARAHLELYERYGKKEDLCAYYMLIGKNRDPEFCKIRAELGGKAIAKIRKNLGLKGVELFYGRFVEEDEHLQNCIKGGTIQGKNNSKTGHIQKLGNSSDHSVIGKKGAEACRQKQVNAFFDPKLRKEISSKGGKTQGKRNAESGHLKRIAQLPNIRTKGKMWITDGKKNMMISQTDPIPNGFRKGKTQKKSIDQIKQTDKQQEKE